MRRRNSQRGTTKKKRTTEGIVNGARFVSVDSRRVLPVIVQAKPFHPVQPVEH